MELDTNEAAQILRAHNIEVAPRDPRTLIEIATHYTLTGSSALPDDYKPLDSVARIQQGIAWQSK